MNALSITIEDREEEEKVKSIPKGIPKKGWGYISSVKSYRGLKNFTQAVIVRIEPFRKELTKAVDSVIKQECQEYPEITEEARFEATKQITDEVLRYSPGEFSPRFAKWGIDRADRLIFLACEQLRAVGKCNLFPEKILTPEEEIVEREIKRKLAVDPDEYAKAEKRSAYLIRKELLEKQSYYNGYLCAVCFKRKKSSKLRAIRVNKDKGSHQTSDYILLCDKCGDKRDKENKTRREWRCNKPPKRKRGLSKTTFYNSIRVEVFARDKACPYCGEKDRVKLGLAPIRPLSKGGELSLDNHTVCCQKCRGSKKDKLPLDFFWSSGDFLWDQLDQQLDDTPTVKDPGMNTRINRYVLAETMQFLSKLIANKDLDREIRNKSERLIMKLSETDADRSRERKVGLRI